MSLSRSEQLVSLQDYLDGEKDSIVEVMSPTTGRIDLHEKLIAYKQLESVRECVLISEGQVRVEVHRNIQGDWREESLGNPSDLLALDSVGSSIPLADIYRGVRF